MKIAVVVGHDKKDGGAYSDWLKINEYDYNLKVAEHLKNVDIYLRTGVGGYKTQMKALADTINPKNYDLVVELHFNAFNGKAQGVEVVKWRGNKFTNLIGENYCKRISTHFGINNRGVKFADKGGRGYWFNYYLTCSTLILEPFFGDEKQALRFSDYKEYACVINEWIEYIK